MYQYTDTVGLTKREGWLCIDAAKICRNRDCHDLCDLPPAARKALKPLIAKLLRGKVTRPEAQTLGDGSRVEAMWDEPPWAFWAQLESYRWIGWWYFSPDRKTCKRGYINVHQNDF